ncbi:hypothetical protein Fot_32459 [Forsythia ovata]|uniref:Uncharacterized protein n=1 Tax=Forsythia ovata TaxID=205694 RepID=A0ABD1T7V4_9LAMI
MVDSGDSDLEEIGENAPGEIVVMVEPIWAICSISKLSFNANYFKMLRKKHLQQLCGVINLSDYDSDAEEIYLTIGKPTAEKVVDLQKQREESLKRWKDKGVAGPSGRGESGGDGEFISHRTHRINLGLAPEEVDRVEKWVEYIRELSGGHENPESDPCYWACSKYPTKLSMSNFTKVMSKYKIPDEIRLIFPSKADRPCDPLEGQIAIMSDAFEYGMRLPLHHFLGPYLEVIMCVHTKCFPLSGPKP